MSASAAMLVPAPDALKKAVYARRDHFLANVATLTMKQARRLIETDLGLGAKALDEAATKAAVAKYVDRVLAAGDRPPEKLAASKENRPPAATASPAPAKPVSKPAASSPAADEEATEADSDADSGSLEDGSEMDSEPPSTKKRRAVDASAPARKKTKRANAKKTRKAKARSAPAPVAVAVAGLREVCKRAGLTYQHVFMRHKEDAGRIEALETILRENGLDANASDKAVAKVRARVELARDLDGIDASNVIEGGRRRRAVATDQWGQAINYAERDAEDSDASDEEDDASDEDGDASDEVEAEADDAEPADSEEPADVFFFDDDDDEEEETEESDPAVAETANDEKPAEAAPKAPRRGGALYSDSDEE